MAVTGTTRPLAARTVTLAVLIAVRAAAAARWGHVSQSGRASRSVQTMVSPAGLVADHVGGAQPGEGFGGRVQREDTAVPPDDQEALG